MKIFLIMFLLITSIFAATHPLENERLCKLFTLKAKTYKKNMREDAYAIQTLESYQKRANMFCKKH
jgi:hypothetical protein